MNKRKLRETRAVNWKLLKRLGLIISVVLLICAIAFVLHYLTSQHAEQNSVAINETSTEQDNTAMVNSPYLKDENEHYEQHAEEQAQKSHDSYINVGKANDIEPNKPITLPNKAHHHFDYQAQLHRHQRRAQQTEHPIVVNHNKPEQKQPSHSIFDDALNKAMQSNDTKSQGALLFKQVSVPAYHFKPNGLPPSDVNGTVLAPPRILAGSTLYGIVRNTINSDFAKTPVIAEVVVGKYTGARLIGSFTKPNQYNDGISITFNKMIFHGMEIAIQAIATNADYQPNIYDDANHHILSKAVGLGASAILGGVEMAAKPFEGSNQPIVVATNAGTAQGPTQPPSARYITYSVAAGGAKKTSSLLEPTFKDMVNRPTTITVNAGHAIGILFTKTAVLKGGAHQNFFN